MSCLDSSGKPTQLVVALPGAPLGNWLFKTLRFSARSFAGDITIEGKLAVLVRFAGATQVLSKSRKNCSPLAFEGQSYSVNAPSPGVSVVLTSTLTFREVK